MAINNRFERVDNYVDEVFVNQIQVDVVKCIFLKRWVLLMVYNCNIYVYVSILHENIIKIKQITVYWSWSKFVYVYFYIYLSRTCVTRMLKRNQYSTFVMWSSKISLKSTWFILLFSTGLCTALKSYTENPIQIVKLVPEIFIWL